MSTWHRLPTEAINPTTRRIDALNSAAIVRHIVNADRRVLVAVRREARRIARGADWIAAALGSGGRLILVGAGTSGRLGVLEAAEIPPTFGTSPKIVRAVIAGGRGAVFRAREGAEDDRTAGARQLAALNVSRRDVVVGISASGVTPFVKGAMAAARRQHARVIIVTCAPRPATRALADLMIGPQVGPEIVAGSTRLKAGTATKMVLNALTTTAMILVGKTYGNLMVDVRTGSAKLKDRARRIVMTITGVTSARARALLVGARWNVKAAIVMQSAGLSHEDAIARLRASNGRVRGALQSMYSGTRSRPSARARASRTAP